ncbi:MAG: GPW/gp25 family protein [Ruminococcaceae bacterium]|nr:GPW/gp25 family protein [Oscillospiraceae bacterium]
MTVTVNSGDNYELTLAQSETLKSVLQNVAVLLNTRCGTSPMYREFGLPMEFIDKPIDVAETIAVSEISEALEKFEPRATLQDLRLVKNAEGTMNIEVEVSIDAGE